MPAAYAGGASGAESARVGWNLGLLAFYPVRVQNRGGSVCSSITHFKIRDSLVSVGES